MDLINKLTESGVLGVLLSIALIAIYFLFKENKVLQEKRIEDALEIRTKMLEPIQVIQTNLSLILEIVKQQQTKLDEKPYSGISPTTPQA